MHLAHRTLNLLLLASLIILAANGASGAVPTPIFLKVDARDGSRRVLHTTLHIPAQPDPLTLFYPKWIPGEHGPTGPITDLAAIRFTDRVSHHGQLQPNGAKIVPPSANLSAHASSRNQESSARLRF